MAPRTVADAFGPEIADRLARWAIDALVEPPSTISTYATRLRASLIAEGRGILDDAGIDWRALKGTTSAGRARSEDSGSHPTGSEINSPDRPDPNGGGR